MSHSSYFTFREHFLCENWTGLVWTELVWTDCRSGLVWSGLNWSGLTVHVDDSFSFCFFHETKNLLIIVAIRLCFSHVQATLLFMNTFSVNFFFLPFIHSERSGRPKISENRHTFHLFKCFLFFTSSLVALYQIKLFITLESLLFFMNHFSVYFFGIFVSLRTFWIDEIWRNWVDNWLVEDFMFTLVQKNSKIDTLFSVKMIFIWNELFVNNFDCKSSVFCFKLVQFHFKKEIFWLLVGF